MAGDLFTSARPPPRPPDLPQQATAVVVEREEIVSPLVRDDVKLDHVRDDDKLGHVWNDVKLAHTHDSLFSSSKRSDSRRCANPDETVVSSDVGREGGAPPLRSSADCQPDDPGELAHKTVHRDPLALTERGCKSDRERVTSPSGPSRDLPVGYDDGVAMRDDGEGLGPPLCLRSHGEDTRGVLPSPTLLTGQLIDASSPPPVQPIGAGDDGGETLLSSESGPAAATIRIEPLPHLFTARTFPVDFESKPLRQRTRRIGKTVVLSPGPDVGTGEAYRRHVPLTSQIRINDMEGKALSSLVDTGASLSVIDRNLLEALGGKIGGQPMPIHGLGSVRTLGWATLTFFIDAKDSKGRPVTLESTVDFHVIEAFAPGLCLGQDFISTHGVIIDSKTGLATVHDSSQSLTFKVHEHLLAPFAKEAELCIDRDTVVPARSHSWVPVDVACLAPEMDYTVFPRMTVDSTADVRLAGPIALMSRSTPYVLLTNLGHVDAVLERRTPVADAAVAHLGEVNVITGTTFELQNPSVPPAARLSTACPPPGGDVDTDPLDICEVPDEVGPPSSLVEQATTLVDDVFKVGIGADGTPPSAIVDVLRSNRDAFSLDGRPGRVVGHEMGIDLRDDAAVHPEAPRRASPEKRRAMDSAIDQLLEWNVIEPSCSPVSFPVLMVRQRDEWRFCVDYRQLNTHTVADSYPLPTIDSVFNSLVGKKVFSSLDALRGYHQLGVRE
ncbi:hypothetical protein A4X13_0g7406 [Tilletia indica]|uniref:Uncharacterized protein n=1 Tax=Tilletia indica TaxID=43049 RepID=A0A177TJX9_9BASI|nr:hypothetical protein A4X13_0g7406 [Tilletia indica]